MESKKWTTIRSRINKLVPREYLGIHGNKYKDLYKVQDNPLELYKGIGEIIFDLKPEIYKHVKLFDKDKKNHYYQYDNKINSFIFIPYQQKCTDNDLQKIQKIIDLSYHVDSSNQQLEYPAAKFQLNSRLMRRGYSSEYAFNGLKSYIESTKKFLDINKDYLDNKQKNFLDMVLKRTCDNIHGDSRGYDNRVETEKKDIFLHDLLIEDSKKQVVFLNMPYDEPYKKNDKLVIEPFVDVKTFMGDYVWGLRYNKFITRCSVDFDDNMLFPFRFVLFKQLNHLYFDNWKEEILDSNYEYMGFYLIRYNNDDTQISEIKDECKEVFKFDIKLNETNEQYFIMFVFKNTKSISPDWVKYTPLNYKGNRVEWGHLGDARRTLYIEILQIMCMNTENKAYFYLILNKSKHTEQLCKTINEDFDSNMFCIEASYERAFYKALIEQDISPYSIKDNNYIFNGNEEKRNEIHLLVSRHNKDIVYSKFKEKVENSIDKQLKINSENYDYIEFNDNYILMQVHIDWLEDPKDRMVIRPGDMKEERKKELYKKICIPHDCSKELDDQRRVYQAFLNTKEPKLSHTITSDVLAAALQNTSIKLASPVVSTQLATTTELEQPSNINDGAVSAVSTGQIIQLGGNKYLFEEINIFSNLCKKYQELNNKYKLDKFIYPYLPNGKNNYSEKLTTNIEKYTIYSEGKEINKITNIITPRVHIYYMLSVFPQIILKKILIITANTHIIESLLLLNNNYLEKITVFVINSNMLVDFYLLKQKFKDIIDIYYIGYRYDYNSYETISNIIKDTKYNSIILDYSKSINQILGNELSTTILTLLINKHLDEGYNSYINYNIIPTYNNFLLWLYYIAYKSFYNHNLNDMYSTNFNITTQSSFFIFNNLKQKITKEEEDILITFLKTEELPKYDNYNYPNNYLDNIKKRWEKVILTHSENLERLQNIILKKPKRLNYHRNVLLKIKINNIPEIIYDIPNNYTYNDDALDHQTKCHWGQKKLLLSEIQFFTRICETLQIKSLKKYAVVYIGSAGGHHLPILYNLFPDLIWLLYDPAPYSDVVMKHPNKDKSVFVYNMFFTDETLEHVKKNCQGRKILFISDIRVENKEENIIKDMRDQAYWGMELNAPYMLLKFRLPYEELDSIPKSNKQLNLNEKYISNPNFITNKKNNMIYLKGDVYLQIFPPPYSGELRLFVEQKDNKYEFIEYDYLDIENRLINFNSVIRPTYGNIESDDLEMLNYIPGYDTSIECLMEYQAVQKFYKYFFNITESKILIHKLYDMNFFLEKLTHRNFITCNYDTTNKNLNKTKNNEDKIIKLKYWKEISKLNIGLSAKNQYELIKKNGLSILGEKRYNRALEYLQKYITDLKYVEI